MSEVTEAVRFSEQHYNGIEPAKLFIYTFICSISVQWLARQPSKLKVRVRVSYTAPETFEDWDRGTRHLY